MRFLRCKDDDGDYVDLPSGVVLLGIKPYSSELGDAFLSIVLAYDPEKSEWVTWIYNWQIKGCSSGHYFKTFREAWVEFQDRAGTGAKEALRELINELYVHGSISGPIWSKACKLAGVSPA